MNALLLSLFFIGSLVAAEHQHAVYSDANIVLFDNAEELALEVEKQGEQVIRERLEGAWERTVETYERVVNENTYTHGFLGKNRRFKDSLRKMKKAELKWGMDLPKWKMCKGNTLAYVIQLPKIRHKVYICPKAYVQSDDVLYQIMLHEAAHMGGTTSECQASKMEVLAITFSPIQNALKSGYWDRCGLKKFVDRLNQ